VETNKFFLERSGQQHPAKCFEKSLVWCSLSCHGFLFAGLRRLKHRSILRKIDNPAQKIFSDSTRWKLAGPTGEMPAPCTYRVASAKWRCAVASLWPLPFDPDSAATWRGAASFIPTSLLTPRSSIVTP